MAIERHRNMCYDWGNKSATTGLKKRRQAAGPFGGRFAENGAADGR